MICKNILGVDFIVITDWEKFTEIDLPRINYSENELDGVLRIVPQGLLHEISIRKQKIRIKEWNGLPAFFQTAKKTPVPFDLFSAAFYLVSRYEEYLDYKPDDHGRFPASQSLAFKEGFLEKPLVNIWVMSLFEILQEKYPEYSFNHGQFRFMSTIDIDMAFNYAHKGIWRNLGGFAREAMSLDIKKMNKRVNVLSGKEKDPLDNFDYQFEIHEKFGVDPLYFILLSDGGKFDKNIDYRDEAFVDIIMNLNSRYRIGIHPSYNSNKVKKKLREEIDRLENITLKPVDCSRQHFLKLDIKETYEILEKHGIREDHSMGYSETPGFRASLCTPFLFYDLQNNESSHLMLFPFAVMDVALMRFLKLTPAEATQRIGTLLEEVRQVKGTFISVFHNESLSDFAEWEGWREVYENMLTMATIHDTVPAL